MNYAGNDSNAVSPIDVSVISVDDDNESSFNIASKSKGSLDQSKRNLGMTQQFDMP